jgi:hypothetical protein
LSNGRTQERQATLAALISSIDRFQPYVDIQQKMSKLFHEVYVHNLKSNKKNVIIKIDGEKN